MTRRAVDDADVSTLLLLSARYALGRRTYTVHEVCGLVRQYHALLLPADRQTLIRDIRDQERFGYGSGCDRDEWLALLAFLEEKKASGHLTDG